MPDDVWQQILMICGDYDSLLVAGCVCKTWLAVSDVLLLAFFHRATSSDKLLTKFHALKRIFTLDLSYNAFISDSALRNLTDLTELLLVHNTKITNDAVSRLTNLTQLKLTRNSIVSDIGTDLKKLTYLDAVDGKLTPSCLEKLVSLKHLVLQDNYEVADTTLSNLTNMTSLDLAYNTTITNDYVRSLAGLQHLDLSSNATITDDALKELPNVTSLRLSYNKAITDDGLSALTSLTHLNLCTAMHVTNVSVSRCTCLTFLDLQSNPHVTDDGIKDLLALKSLGLAGNLLITNAGLVKLTNLESLNLAGSAITDDGITHLTKLRVLRLILSSGTSSITWWSVQMLTELQELFIDQNNAVLPAIPSLTNLVTLSMPKTHITTELFNLTNLTVLDLWNTKQLVYENLTRLDKLVILGIGRNPAVTDESLRQLTNLTSLDIYEDRQVTTKCVLSLPKLTHLSYESSGVLQAEVVGSGITCYTPYDWWRKFLVGADLSL